MGAYCEPPYLGYFIQKKAVVEAIGPLACPNSGCLTLLVRELDVKAANLLILGLSNNLLARTCS